MAIFFTTLFSALGSGAGAGAGAAAAAAGTGLSASGILAGASTIVGGLASIAAGRQQAASLNAQAKQDELQASQDLLNGRQEAVNALTKLNQDMAAGVVASYASGLSGSGSTQVALDEAQRIGEMNTNIIRSNAEASAAARRASASQRRMDAKAAKDSGIFGAITGGLQQAQRVYTRG